MKHPILIAANTIAITLVALLATHAQAGSAAAVLKGQYVAEVPYNNQGFDARNRGVRPGIQNFRANQALALRQRQQQLQMQRQLSAGEAYMQNVAEQRAPKFVPYNPSFGKSPQLQLIERMQQNKQFNTGISERALEVQIINSGKPAAGAPVAAAPVARALPAVANVDANAQRKLLDELSNKPMQPGLNVQPAGLQRPEPVEVRGGGGAFQAGGAGIVQGGIGEQGFGNGLEHTRAMPEIQSVSDVAR
jgi:hypothetical protein